MTKKPTVFTAPTFLPADSLTHLTKSHEHLDAALVATEPGGRYVAAHLAALRAASALVVAAPRPLPAKGRRSAPLRSVWIRLAETDSSLGDWGAYFSASAPKRTAIEAGADDVVSDREADDILAAADRFIAAIERMLNQIPHTVTTGHDGTGKATA